VHLHQQVLHSLQFGFFSVQFDLERGALVIVALVFGFLQSVDLSQMALLLLNLLFAERVNHLCKFIDPRFFRLHLLLSLLCLSLEHVDFGATLLSFSDCGDCALLFRAKHAA